MTAQMLVQIPLLIAEGCLLRPPIPEQVWAGADDWNHRGITGLLLATLAGLLPRTLDAATTQPLVAVALRG